MLSSQDITTEVVNITVSSWILVSADITEVRIGHEPVEKQVFFFTKFFIGGEDLVKVMDKNDNSPLFLENVN